MSEAKKAVGDLTIPLKGIARHFFQGNKAIFALNGKGQYVDLSPKYKAEKEKHVHFVYPILRRSGFLERSITNASDPDAIAEIVNKDTLLVGTHLFYGAFLQKGTRRMPARPFLFVGPEAPFYSTQEQKNRPYIWLQILDDYVRQKMKTVTEEK